MTITERLEKMFTKIPPYTACVLEGKWAGMVGDVTAVAKANPMLVWIQLESDWKVVKANQLQRI